MWYDIKFFVKSVLDFIRVYQVGDISAYDGFTSLVSKFKLHLHQLVIDALMKSWYIVHIVWFDSKSNTASPILATPEHCVAATCLYQQTSSLDTKVARLSGLSILLFSNRIQTFHIAKDITFVLFFHMFKWFQVTSTNMVCWQKWGAVRFSLDTFPSPIVRLISWKGLLGHPRGCLDSTVVSNQWKVTIYPKSPVWTFTSTAPNVWLPNCFVISPLPKSFRATCMSWLMLDLVLSERGLILNLLPRREDSVYEKLKDDNTSEMPIVMHFLWELCIMHRLINFTHSLTFYKKKNLHNYD